MHDSTLRADKRVCFDFSITFSNGGGIQGQDFRLDIDDDVSDEALAAYIIRDMRLLMVSEVRILNKRIIEERHKRSAADTASFIDLSHTIEHGMVTLKGIAGPLICDYLSREQSRAIYAPGTQFHIGRIDLVANTGTYIDTPFHRYADGGDLTSLDFNRISNVPAVVVRATDLENRSIDCKHFATVDCRNVAVLVNTGWDRHWGTEHYFEPHPHLTRKAAEYLRDQGALLVGIDSINIDDMSDPRRPVHTILLGAGIPIVEHLTCLDRLPNTAFRFSSVPPKIKGLGTFPVRAHAHL
jgi:kynurenine formamidase